MEPRILGIVLACAAAAAATLWITPCHARYLEVKEPPAAPRITFPAGTTNGLTTNVAWIGDAHDALEVIIADTPSLSAEAVWNSGTVETADNYFNCGPLPSDHALYAFVRLRNSAGWGPWLSLIHI